MKHIANFLRHPIEFFKHQVTQKTLIGSVFVIVILCSLILLARGTSPRGEQVVKSNTGTVAAVPLTSTVTPTKWWIKMTATSSLTPSRLVLSAVPTESSASNCPGRFSSSLKVETYAFIALTPPLPNRLRSGAGLSNTYLGHLEPGVGLKIIDGPVCADGYSWWLVESVYGGLRGWTVEGKSSEQWIVPCPNPYMLCSQMAVPTSSSIVSKDDKNKDKNDSNCKSDKLAVGMLAQVGQDSLLVVRSEPHTGGVIGRASPMSIVRIVDGPTCTGGAVWWKVNVVDLGLVGWATENDIYACPKDSECNLESL